MASDPTLVRPEYGLHPYQRQVYRDILSALERPERRVVAHLPTGAGKTRIATHIAAHMLNARDDGNALVIWLASSEELCEQAAESLSRAWSFVGQRKATVTHFWGNGQLDLRGVQGGFLVTGLGKLYAASRSDIGLLPHLARRAAGVIFDEAHQAIADTYAFVTEQLCSGRPPLLGLTATPGRTSQVSQEDFQLAEMFAHTKVSIDPPGQQNPVTYLINNGYLAEPRFVPINVESATAMSEPTADADYTPQDLNALGADQQRNLRIAELAEKSLERHARIIVFCPSVGSALECSALLGAKNLAADVITANTPGDERQRIINLFKSDAREHRVIFNYGVLTAGFDAPRTSCVLIARPTTSLVLYSQMAGRAMRGPQSGGNRWAEILTVVDKTLVGFWSVTDAFTNWEELWTTG